MENRELFSCGDSFEGLTTTSDLDRFEVESRFSTAHDFVVLLDGEAEEEEIGESRAKSSDGLSGSSPIDDDAWSSGSSTNDAGPVSQLSGGFGFVSAAELLRSTTQVTQQSLNTTNNLGRWNGRSGLRDLTPLPASEVSSQSPPFSGSLPALCSAESAQSFFAVMTVAEQELLTPKPMRKKARLDSLTDDSSLPPRAPRLYDSDYSTDSRRERL